MRSCRARALRVAGEAGRRDLLPVCINALNDEDIDCRFWAAHSALLLGDGMRRCAPCIGVALAPGPWRAAARWSACSGLPVRRRPRRC
ncbi:MAG: HEAT repeat domain-containing protein [Comamonadaceae bacterium]|nr:HEAT repeat domain-containing protein [Comamonadaceae bacterium]